MKSNEITKLSGEIERESGGPGLHQDVGPIIPLPNRRPRRQWSKHDLRLLLKAHRRHGPQWTLILEEIGPFLKFQGRKATDLKDKMRHYTKKKMQESPLLSSFESQTPRKRGRRAFESSVGLCVQNKRKMTQRLRHTNFLGTWKRILRPLFIKLRCRRFVSSHPL